MEWYAQGLDHNMLGLLTVTGQQIILTVIISISVIISFSS